MTLKRILLVLCISICSIYGIKAQNGTISGTLVDEVSNEKIPFATLVLQSDGTIKGVSSDFNGNFSFEKIATGTYQLKATYIGFTDKVIKDIKISKSNPIIDLGIIALSVATEALKEVEITGVNKTQVTKIDRKTYTASDFATAKGGTASDVLNKLPAVNVASDGKVSVRGTEDFMVYLNGKPTNMEPSVLLAQIASNNIDKVDIISVPTARYDAQGKGGIVNITTKKNVAQGLSVSVNALIGGAPWNNVTDIYSGHELKDDRYGGGFNLSYGTDKITLYGGFNYNKKNINGKRSGEARVLTSNGPDEYFHMNAKNGERPEWFENYSANAGIDFNLSDNNQLSLSYFYGNRNEGRAAYYIYNTFFAAADQQTGKHSERFMYNPNVDNRYGEYSTFNVDYLSKLENNATFKIAAAYENSDLSRELNNKNYFYTSRADVDNDINNNYGNAYQYNNYSLSDDTPLIGLRFATDYNKDFENGNTFGTGLQVQYTNIEGEFKFENDLVAKNLDNAIDLTRTVYAGYVDYSGNSGALSYIVGLRAEYQDQTMDIEETDYVPIFGSDLQSNYSQEKLDLFPSAHLSYKLNDDNKLTLAGSRRINRASVTKLAPFLYRRHFEVYVVGDPELEAEYLNNAEISYNTSVGKNTFNLTGFYRGTDNTVFRVNTVTTALENPSLNAILGEDVLIRSYTNAGNSTSLGAEFDANIMVSSFAKFFVGASLYNYQIKGDVFGYDVDQNSTNWSIKGNLVLNLSKEFKFNYDYSRISNTVTSQGQNDAFTVSNIALNYQPKNAKEWNFSFRGLDIFAQNDQGLDTNAYNAANDQIFYQETLYERMGPVFELGVTYSFNTKGKKKSKSFEGDKHFK